MALVGSESVFQGLGEYYPAESLHGSESKGIPRFPLPFLHRSDGRGEHVSGGCREIEREGDHRHPYGRDAGPRKHHVEHYEQEHQNRNSLHQIVVDSRGAAHPSAAAHGKEAVPHTQQGAEQDCQERDFYCNQKPVSQEFPALFHQEVRRERLFYPREEVSFRNGGFILHEKGRVADIVRVGESDVSTPFFRCEDTASHCIQLTGLEAHYGRCHGQIINFHFSACPCAEAFHEIGVQSGPFTVLYIADRGGADSHGEAYGLFILDFGCFGVGHRRTAVQPVIYNRVKGAVGLHHGQEFVEFRQDIRVSFREGYRACKFVLPLEGNLEAEFFETLVGKDGFIADEDLGDALADRLDRIGFGIHEHRGQTFDIRILSVVARTGHCREYMAGKIGLASEFRSFTLPSAAGNQCRQTYRHEDLVQV